MTPWLQYPSMPQSVCRPSGRHHDPLSRLSISVPEGSFRSILVNDSQNPKCPFHAEPVQQGNH